MRVWLRRSRSRKIEKALQNEHVCSLARLVSRHPFTLLDDLAYYVPRVVATSPDAWSRLKQTYVQANSTSIDPRTKSLHLPDEKARFCELVFGDLFRCDVQTRRFRLGAILERMVLRLVRPKYSYQGAVVKDNCFVRVDNWRSARDVDIGAWSHPRQSGEFHACKVSLVHLKRQDIENLDEIYERIRKGGGAAVVTVVSCMEQHLVESAIESGRWVEPFGRQRLLDLRESLFK